MSLSGVFFVVVAITLSSLPPYALEDRNLTAHDFGIIDDVSGIPPSLIEGLIAVGSVMIAIGIVSLIVAYGLLKGMEWSWTMTIVFIDSKHYLDCDYNCHCTVAISLARYRDNTTGCACRSSASASSWRNGQHDNQRRYHLLLV